MNEHTITDAEREALAAIIASWSQEPRAPFPHERDLAGRILASDWLAARVAVAVDRERAAWATKVEALALEFGRRSSGPEFDGADVARSNAYMFAETQLRALLAEGKP